MIPNPTTCAILAMVLVKVAIPMYCVGLAMDQEQSSLNLTIMRNRTLFAVVIISCVFWYCIYKLITLFL
jgi:hypothetical protein